MLKCITPSLHFQDLYMNIMDYLSLFLSILSFLALVIAYSLTKPKSNSSISKVNEAPEPSGAWPFIGHLHLLRGEQPVARILGALANKYGPIFSLRLGTQRAVVVSSWEMVKDCFTTNDTVFASRPVMAVSKYFYDYAVFALVPYGPYWRDVRKMVTLELLTQHRLEKLKHVRASEVDSCIKHLYYLSTNNASLPTKVTINKLLEDLTFNISMRILAGKRFSARLNENNDTDEDRRIQEAIKSALYLSGVFVVSDAIPSLEWMDIGGHLKALKKTAKEVDKILGKWLEEHLHKRELECAQTNNEEEEADFMDVMLSSLPEDATMSGHRRDTIIKATTLILILTGSESTAETITWALSLMLNNNHVLKKAQDELDNHVGRDRWVEESDIKDLPYLQAVVKETLRLYPPGPLAGPREASEDCYIGGYHVLKGTRLIVNLWQLHRDPRVWSDPFEFQPERFLKGHANVNYRGQSFEYIPFSSGRRMCPAVTFGLQVVQLTLARLLHGFDISTPKGMPVDMSEGVGIALPKIKPLEVVLTPRLPLRFYQNL